MSKHINRSSHARRSTNAKPAPKPATESNTSVPERYVLELFHENGMFFIRFYRPVGRLVDQYAIPCALEELPGMRGNLLGLMAADGPELVETTKFIKELAMNRRNDGHDKTRPTNG